MMNGTSQWKSDVAGLLQEVVIGHPMRGILQKEIGNNLTEVKGIAHPSEEMTGLDIHHRLAGDIHTFPQRTWTDGHLELIDPSTGMEETCSYRPLEEKEKGHLLVETEEKDHPGGEGTGENFHLLEEIQETDRHCYPSIQRNWIVLGGLPLPLTSLIGGRPGPRESLLEMSGIVTEETVSGLNA